MGIFQKMLLDVQARQRPMVLIASLSRNDPELAQAALDGGADVVKVHINVHHHASNVKFGPLKDERPALEKILRIWEGKPAGIVPGDSAELDHKTLADLPGLGFQFLSLYLAHAEVGFLPPVQKMDRMLALSSEDGEEVISGLDLLPIQVCELSIMPPDSYGKPLTYHDLARFAAVAKQTKLPLVVPTQHKIPCEAVGDLLSVDVSAVMVGAIVAGETPRKWFDTVSMYRKVIDNLYSS